MTGPSDSPLADQFEAAYHELRALAHQRLKFERSGLTLNTTALVHEAYLRLLSAKTLHWQDRHHFFAVASRTMRRILIDQARERSAAKRGGNKTLVSFTADELRELFGQEQVDPDALLALDAALHRLEEVHPRAARAIELRYFGGLSLEEVGGVCGSSAATALRDVRFALAWLAAALSDE